MKLTFVKSIVEGKFLIVVSTTEFAQSDLDLMALHGEPIVSIGGELNDTDDAFLMNFPKVDRLIKSDLPYTIEVSDSTVPNNALSLLDVALSITAKVQLVIDQAMTDLRAKTDTFSGTTEVTI
ncbi:hypothetical protein Molly5_85 [Maribacter phage Molly_5]|uniref:Uncharacterized protein n=2 Tax=Mollyvirus TaxID=2948826 RepID=A0A8E4UY44_9CAUD|nr:hypothetical protein M1M29_gp085 [Maribacter phage Molly_1]YP_010357332.1 hypothetical protein M1M30_gp083 [Maribacter phage Colly_1]QQO97772.1 hypothetical protein Molly2_85 [Maribacter phage Molly_2]QQO97972.1 hypothetical protein Molly3_85 [Maribacter phage Molly_3]QQO98172.1 hypothetical protein Molly4_85 [Maribacter phage Molly_4]QQO98372.1 hypothetical protein Molly5_85 [Maribacter phage Molly_5]QQO97370.1 hypothetical protein Colly1_83 [Maribacter phage Colly_1]